jgi:hypothetical protein
MSVAPLQERHEHRYVLTVLCIFRMLGEQVALFQLDRDQDVRSRCDCEHQKRQRHGRGRPEREQEFARIEDADERRRKYEELVAQLYERGKALSIATLFGVDDVIDPADSRSWLANLLSSMRPPERRAGKKRPAIDAW